MNVHIQYTDIEFEKIKEKMGQKGYTTVSEYLYDISKKDLALS